MSSVFPSVDMPTDIMIDIEKVERVHRSGLVDYVSSCFLLQHTLGWPPESHIGNFLGLQCEYVFLNVCLAAHFVEIFITYITKIVVIIIQKQSFLIE